jgi:hypothetical protein
MTGLIGREIERSTLEHGMSHQRRYRTMNDVRNSPSDKGSLTLPRLEVSTHRKLRCVNDSLNPSFRTISSRSSMEYRHLALPPVLNQERVRRLRRGIGVVVSEMEEEEGMKRPKDCRILSEDICVASSSMLPVPNEDMPSPLS